MYSLIFLLLSVSRLMIKSFVRLATCYHLQGRRSHGGRGGGRGGAGGGGGGAGGGSCPPCPLLTGAAGATLPFAHRDWIILPAELSVTRDCWRKQVPPVCGGVLNDFIHACHRSAPNVQHVE